MMGDKTCAAILCSDIHLCHTMPAARCDDDWYAAMEYQLDQLTALQREHSVPILCAGDVFDRWNSVPQLVNFAIEVLPTMYSIPGQHDMPNHNLSELHRSAYHTLIEAQKLIPLSKGLLEPIDVATDVVAFGFPWECDVAPINRSDGGPLRVAVIHRYLYTLKIAGYPNAPIENRLDVLAPQLKGFDVAHFGDNHIPFSTKIDRTTAVNTGCLFPRKRDERKHDHGVHLLFEDASVEFVSFDSSQDKWIEDVFVDENADVPDMGDFIRELESIETDSLDFREAVSQYVSSHKKGLSVRTTRVLSEIMDAR